jgi:hypothetical protein
MSPTYRRMNTLNGEEVDKMSHQHHQHIYDVCRDHIHAYVLVELEDGSSIDGIITGLDHESVYLATPIELHEQLSRHQAGSHHRQYGYARYGDPGYRGGPDYGSGYGVWLSTTAI